MEKRNFCLHSLLRGSFKASVTSLCLFHWLCPGQIAITPLFCFVALRERAVVSLTTVYLVQLHELWRKHCPCMGGRANRDWCFCSKHSFIQNILHHSVTKELQYCFYKYFTFPQAFLPAHLAHKGHRSKIHFRPGCHIIWQENKRKVMVYGFFKSEVCSCWWASLLKGCQTVPTSPPEADLQEIRWSMNFSIMNTV